MILCASSQVTCIRCVCVAVTSVADVNAKDPVSAVKSSVSLSPCRHRRRRHRHASQLPEINNIVASVAVNRHSTVLLTKNRRFRRDAVVTVYSFQAKCLQTVFRLPRRRGDRHVHADSQDQVCCVCVWTRFRATSR